MGYNSGDTYEEKLFSICLKKGLISKGSQRAGADGNRPDLEINFNNHCINIEVKNNKNPDYGQKKLDYNIQTNSWGWAKPDKISRFYEELNLLDKINNEFIPIWYSKRIKIDGRYQNKPGEHYDINDFKSDQRNFENPNIEIPNEALFTYYEQKQTFYIQIEDSGFYYLRKDAFNLGVPKFDGKLTLRFRVKHAGHTKNPPHSCQFLGALKLSKKPTFSTHNLEGILGQTFPFKN